MKKLLFLLTVLSAISFNHSYAQLAPRAVTCLTPDALHPVAGRPFTYTIDVPATPSPGTAWSTLNYTWFVTQEPAFINSGTLTANRETASGLLLAATDAEYNNAASTANSISLTWRSFTYNPANPIFVVVNVVGANGTCSPMNMKVFKIEPVNAFTLDIDNRIVNGPHTKINGAGANYGDLYTFCITNIKSATYDATAPSGVLYDFGKDSLYYEVVAANWSDAWAPTVQLTGIDALESVTVQWSKDSTFTSNVVTMTGSAVGTGATPTVYTSPSNVTATAAGGFVGAAGESIYIRVVLDHTNGALNYQGLVDQAIALAVDGITVPASGTGVGDVHYEAGGSPSACSWVDGYTNDIAQQLVKARPTITASAAPAPGLLPVKP